MTENKRNGSEWTTISLQVTTRDELASLMPKSWDWDRCLKELTSMWKSNQGKVVKSGKSPQDNSTS